MYMVHQHCPREAASTSARTSTTASNGSDGAAGRACTPTPCPPFDSRAPGPFDPPSTARRGDFLTCGGGGSTRAGSICTVEITESVRLSVELRSMLCPSTARSSVELMMQGMSSSSSSSSGTHLVGVRVRIRVRVRVRVLVTVRVGVRVRVRVRARARARVRVE